MTAEQILARLVGVKQVKDGWKACCPAHEDRYPSLSISIGDDGRVLLHCHAGCSTSAICNAIGISMGDLFAEGQMTQRQSSQLSFPDTQCAINSLSRRAGKPIAWWQYDNANGQLAFHIVRFDNHKGKTFRPLRRDGNRWYCSFPEGRLPLYRLPELTGTERVYVCEGEQCVEAAISLGLVATTSAQGAKAAEKSDWSVLAGREVVILPDNDQAGLSYAKKVAKILTELSPPARVKIVELPDLPAGGDIVDFIHQAGDTEPKSLRQQIEVIVDAADESCAAPPTEVDQEGPVLICMADVESQEISWLWPGKVPLGRMTLLVGRPGEGKSFLTTDMAARISIGARWPDGSACPQGSVVLISAEDDPGDTIRPRLDAHGADVHKIHLLDAVRRLDSEGKSHDVMFTLADVSALESALERLPDCRLVIVDPIGSFLGGSTDAHRDNEVRSVLTPVAKLAERFGVAVLVVAHRRKSSGTVADDLALGSRAFTGIARAVWHLNRDPENKTRRLLLPGKNNLAPEGSGLAFTIWGDPASIIWENDPVAMTADDCLAVEQRTDRANPESEELQHAVEFLSAALADGPRPTREVEEEAKEMHGIKKRTLERARKKLSVESFREKVPGPWSLRLKNETNTAMSSSESIHGGLGGVAEFSEF